MAKASRRKTMDDEELLHIIDAYEKSAMGSSTAAGVTVGGRIYPASSQMTTLEMDRYNALNYYWGRPLGNEIPDRSQIVMPELRDVIEWIMPTLMDMFAATDRICEFEPETPGDEEACDIETEVVNYVFLRQNNGFMLLHDLFKDALLLRNGYDKVGWETKREVAIERYTGLTEDAVAQLLHSDGEIEVLEQAESMTQIETAPGRYEHIPIFDLKIRRVDEKRTLKVYALPPEEIYISPRARFSLDESPFVMHKTETPRGDLIAEGYDPSIINRIPAGNRGWDLEIDALARDEVVDQLSEDMSPDRSMQLVEVREAYLRVDYDQDGIPELRCVKCAGTHILENDEIEEMPISYAAPIRMPHRHVGISLYDVLADLQQLKTMVTRNAVDNFFYANNKRLAVDSDAVNIQDLLTSRPGGVIRTTGAPSQSILPIEHGSIVNEAVQFLGYIDQLREMRTGIGKDVMGLDADALEEVTRGGQLAAMSAAAKKVELIARLLAEGVKDLFRKIHAELIRNQDVPLELQLKGKWAKIDPSTWRKRTKVKVNVGLGSGNREELRQNLMMLGQMQQQLEHFGMVGPEQAYETFKHMAKALGFENPGQFALDPNSPQYKMAMAHRKPPPPPPQVQSAQIRAETDLKKAQINAQIEEMKARGASAQQIAKLEAQLRQGQFEMAKEHTQAAAELTHAAIQKQQDRGMQMYQTDSQLAETLMRVLGQIIASQLNKDPGVDAGQTLSNDYREASSAIE